MTLNPYEQELSKEKQLKAELAAAQKHLAATKQRLEAAKQHLEAQRSQLRSQYGEAMLALIEGDERAKVVITDVVERLVFIDEQGRTLARTDDIFLGQRVEVKLIDESDDESIHK